MKRNSIQIGSSRPAGPREGSAAIEFALVAPMLVLLLAGMVVYGGWFWLAQSVQSLATESARAALGGMDDAERRDLAAAFVAREATTGSGLDPALVTTTVTSDAEAVRVSVAYDAQAHPILQLAGPLPKPPTLIERTAVVRIGGY
ncbi:TadE/TadG family type IV pilus assembly protein [Brevundimonas sp. NIBR10]|uniref:TadE/TadG family type IV pilus assembly protein n=1 Tax=Brevundimonas sp. NIBR10 TaxID=3015997 RepID=UPI0022F196AC|nr:TadE/TadG family type IV pilus assembly protein [Brevundimonas sp. NIBR10]